MGASLEELSEKLLKTVFAQGDAKSVVECAQAVLGLPVLCFDPSFNLIAFAFKRPCPNTDWEHMVEFGGISYERASGYFNSLDSIIRANGRSMYFSNPPGSGYSQVYCALLSGTRLVGYVGILLNSQTDTDLALAACELLGTVLPYVLDKQNASCHDLSNVLGKEGESDMEDFRACLNKASPSGNRLRIYPPGFVAAVLASDTGSRASLEYVSSILSKSHIRILSKISNDCLLYLLIWGIPSRHEASRVITGMKNMSDLYGLSCGISDVFWEIERLPERHAQAALLRSVGKTLHPERRIFAFTQDYIDLMFYSAMERLGVSASVPECIRQLWEEDMKNNTVYLRTLDVYLRNLRKLGITADMLGVHKNTVINRLNKIQEKTGADIRKDADARKLWAGLHMLRMLQGADLSAAVSEQGNYRI